jgi:hypothetical protein
MNVKITSLMPWPAPHLLVSLIDRLVVRLSQVFMLP